MFVPIPVQTILLQDKRGRNYCIACSELDSDAGKDDPGSYIHFLFLTLPLKIIIIYLYGATIFYYKAIAKKM